MGDAFVKLSKTNLLVQTLHGFSPFFPGTRRCVVEGIASGSKAAKFAVWGSAVFTDIAASIKATFAHVALFFLEEFAQNTFSALKFGNLRQRGSGMCR